MKLLGIIDLAKRWNYTKQGVHQRLKRDPEFPKPTAVVNNKTLIFAEKDIIVYENSKREFRNIKYKHWFARKKWIYKYLKLS